MWDLWLRPIYGSRSFNRFDRFLVQVAGDNAGQGTLSCASTVVYLSRTDPHRTGRKPLREMASRKLSPNTISVWLKKAIYLAYKVAGKDEELGCLHLLWAHETHAFVVSWDAFRNVSLGDIMAVCKWRSHNTFMSFYLRDLVEMEAQLLVLKCFPTAASNQS